MSDQRPSCTVCGAPMVFKCLSCGSTPEPVQSEPERETMLERARECIHSMDDFGEDEFLDRGPHILAAFAESRVHAARIEGLEAAKRIVELSGDDAVKLATAATLALKRICALIEKERTR